MSPNEEGNPLWDLKESKVRLYVAWVNTFWSLFGFPSGKVSGLILLLSHQIGQEDGPGNSSMTVGPLFGDKLSFSKCEFYDSQFS